MNFSIYWQHADAVSKTLYFILLAMSIATWTVFILRLMGTRQLKQQAYAQLSQAITSLKAKLQPLSFEQRKAVAAGYWDLYRYNPQLKEEGKNPFSLDSKEPTENFQDFLKGEVRYASLAKAAPDVAEELFAKTEKDAKERRLSYVRLQKGFEDVK